MLARLVMAFAVISGIPCSSAADELSAEALPPIEAKSYDLRVIRPSRSGRVYLFQKSDQELPDLGRIFLLREGNAPVMGYRVLKVYPDKSQIAAKKVREYRGYETLAPDSTFRAYEKIGDILTVPAQTTEDVSDLNDLEGSPDSGAEGSVGALPEAPPAAPAESDALMGQNEGGELGVQSGADEPAAPPLEEPPPIEEPAPPVGTTPPAELTSEPGPEPSPPPLAPDEVGPEEIEVDESAFRDEGTIDYFPNWAALEVGGVRNSNLPTSTYQRALGLVYGRNFAHNIFMSSADYPDLLTLDAGFYYYKTNATTDGIQKSYTLLPLKAQIRYTRPVSETLSLYVYGGFLYNLVIGQLNVSQEELNTIAVAAPALGVGGLIQFGPNWYIKLNLGLDTVGAGIVLRY